MAIKGNDVALFLSGQSVPVPACNLVVSQPTAKQIVAFGEEEFFTAVQAMSNMSTFIEPLKQGREELNNYTDFQIFMSLLLSDESMKQIILNFFELIFPIYNFEINTADIIFSLKDDSEKITVGMINPFTYGCLGDTINQLFVVQKQNKDEIEYDPANKLAEDIARKLEAGRKKVQNIKNKDNKDMSLIGTYTSILSLGMGISINVLYEYTLFQLYDAFNRYWLKVNYDFYQKVSTTPLMDVSQIKAPDEWSKNLY